MQSTTNKKNSQEYSLNNYFTKEGEPIDFEIFYIDQQEYSYFTQIIIQASVHQESAGYISLIYLSDKHKNNYFSTPLEYYIHQKMTPSATNLYKNDFDKFISQFNTTHNKRFTTPNQFEQYITKHIEIDYIKFISFYFNKPTTEMVVTYSEKDYRCKDFSQFPFETSKRNPVNFSGKGIGTALYHAACHILKTYDLQLHSSNNQTVDGKRMWEKLSKNSKFLSYSDNYFTTITKDRNRLIQTQRKKITV